MVADSAPQGVRPIVRKLGSEGRSRGSREMTIDKTLVSVEDRKAPPSALVIFGASGDLTRRKLFPGLANLARHKRLPDEFAVVGVGRSDFDDDAFRRHM